MTKPSCVWQNRFLLSPFTAKMVLILLCLSVAVNSKADEINDLIFQGADSHYRGDLYNAILKFEEVVRKDPKNEYAYNQLGILYAKQDRFDQAFQVFSIVERIDRQNTFALLWLGILHLRKGEMEPAFTKFKEIIGIDPHHADAYYFIGTIYNFMHNPVMAIEYLKKARDADAEEAETHFRLAKAFHNLDMIANAMLEYRRAMEIKPTYTKAINELGWIYCNQGDLEKACQHWKMTLKINSRDRDAVFNLAKAYNDFAWRAFVSGRKQEAIGYWKRTLSVNPSNKAAKYYLKKLQLRN